MLSFRQRTDSYDSKPKLIFLDLSETLVLTAEEMVKTLSRIPNLKLKSDSIDESLNEKLSQQSLQSYSRLSNDSKRLSKNSKSSKLYSNTALLAPNVCNERLPKLSFVNPIPESMTGLDLNDFCRTEIDWKMLTILRPNTPQEEQYFSKLVQLFRLRHNTRSEDGFELKEAVFRLSRHPRIMRYKPMDFRRSDSFGVNSNENSVNIEEDITYESFTRVPVEDQTDSVLKDILSLTDGLDFKLFDE